MNTYRVAFTYGLPVRYIEADSYEWQPYHHNQDARHATVKFYRECHAGDKHPPLLVAEFNAASVTSVEDYGVTQAAEPMPPIEGEGED